LTHPKPQKRKRTDLQRAKRLAWDAFSLYVRTEECIKTTGSAEYGQCFTCDEVKPFSELDAGHFIGGRKGENLFDRRGVHIQCRRCNRFLHGNLVLYTVRMQRKYGPQIVDELQAQSVKVTHYKIADYQGIATDCKRKLAELIK